MFGIIAQLNLHCIGTGWLVNLGNLFRISKIYSIAQSSCISRNGADEKIAEIY